MSLISRQGTGITSRRKDRKVYIVDPSVYVHRGDWTQDDGLLKIKRLFLFREVKNSLTLTRVRGFYRSFTPLRM